MSISDKLAEFSRTPQTIVNMNLDYCGQDFGVSELGITDSFDNSSLDAGLWGSYTQGTGTVAETTTLDINSVGAGNSAAIWHKAAIDLETPIRYKMKFQLSSIVGSPSVFEIQEHAAAPASFLIANIANHQRIVVWGDFLGTSLRARFLNWDKATSYEYDANDGKWKTTPPATDFYTGFSLATDYVIYFEINGLNQFRILLYNLDESVLLSSTPWADISLIPNDGGNFHFVVGDMVSDLGNRVYSKIKLIETDKVCLATGDYCYKTFNTCRDFDHFYTVAGKDYKFSLKDASPPIPGEAIRPLLTKEPAPLPSELDPARGIATNARVTCEFYDELDNDIGIDPYAEFRSTYPNAPGTFWRKLLARNKYYIGRVLEIKKGFQGLAENEYTTSKYFIDSIDITADGKVKVTAKDPLKWGDTKTIPHEHTAQVLGNPLTAGGVTVLIEQTTGVDIMGPFDAAGYILIEDEIIQYTGKSFSAFSGCTRGKTIGNIVTVAASHAKYTKITQLRVYIAQNPADMMKEIIEYDYGIAAGDIDSAGFDAERDKSISGYSFTGVIDDATPVSKILEELQIQTGGVVYWGDEDQKVKFKIMAPDIAGEYTEINDDDNIIALSIDKNESSRLSRIVILYDRNSLGSLSDKGNFDTRLIDVNADSENPLRHKLEATRRISSRWINNDSIPATLAARISRRYADPPQKVKVKLEVKDSEIIIAQLIKLTTDRISDQDGVAVQGRVYQVTKKLRRSLSEYEYDLTDTAWSKQYGLIAPSGFPDWDSADADEKRYCYIADGNAYLGALNDPAFYTF